MVPALVNKQPGAGLCLTHPNSFEPIGCQQIGCGVRNWPEHRLELYSLLQLHQPQVPPADGHQSLVLPAFDHDVANEGEVFSTGMSMVESGRESPVDGFAQPAGGLHRAGCRLRFDATDGQKLPRKLHWYTERLRCERQQIAIFGQLVPALPQDQPIAYGVGKIQTKGAATEFEVAPEMDLFSPHSCRTPV